mgnify:CR=1 FL=1
MLSSNVWASFLGAVAWASVNFRLLAWLALDVSRCDASLFEATHCLGSCCVRAFQECAAGHESAEFVCRHGLLHLSCPKSTPSTLSRPSVPFNEVTLLGLPSSSASRWTSADSMPPRPRLARPFGRTLRSRSPAAQRAAAP